MADQHDASYFMEKALQTAFSRIGITSPNPPVGAVIVRNNTIVAVGGTQTFGKEHAEIMALKQLDFNAQGCDIYVTLEPCCHFGKTPPCTEAIIRSGIKKVYIAIIDPNPVVSGKGVARLREAGIDVEVMSEFTTRASTIIASFNTYLKKKRPHIIHKAAMTLDGCTATSSGDSKWISNAYSRLITHRLRSLVDAVIIGKGTYMADDPTLNVRIAGDDPHHYDPFQREDGSFFYNMLMADDFEVKKSSPLRVIIGFPSEFKNEKIFFDPNYLIFSGENVKKGPLPSFIDQDKIVTIDAESRQDLMLKVLEELYRRGVMLCMLEGGATLAGSFAEASAIDEVLYFYAPKIIGGGHPLFAGSTCKTIQEGSQINLKSVGHAGDDLIVHGYIELEEICLQES